MDGAITDDMSRRGLRMHVAITGATGLSIASISTNTPIAGGGAYAIISRSLGLEAGGAIGVPLYLSQTLAIALDVFGFRGGWEFVFPQHPDLVVDVATFLVLIAIASVSARFAFRVQYLILATVLLSLIAIAFAFNDGRSRTTWQGFSTRWFTGDTGSVFHDPALQDALTTFDADEIVLFTHPDSEANWQEEGVVDEAEKRFVALGGAGTPEVTP